MNRKTLLHSMALLILMLLLIFDSKTSMIGARDGTELCLNSVIPSLFPFIFLSVALNSTLSGANYTFLHPFAARLGIPRNAESILIPSYLGGYPVGAQCVASLYQSRQLSKSQAERCLAFCNNAGPAFLFGMIAPFFTSPYTPWVLWGIHVLGSVFAALFTYCSPVDNSMSFDVNSRPSSTPRDWLRSSLLAISNICGWIILFRVLLAFLNKWILWLFPISTQILLRGFLELANGCLELSIVSDPKIRFIIANLLLSFGGLCVTMQTASVISGLSLRFYFIGKGIQALFSFTVSYFMMYKNPVPFLIFLLFLHVVRRKIQKNSSNLKAYVV